MPRALPTRKAKQAYARPRIHPGFESRGDPTQAGIGGGDGTHSPITPALPPVSARAQFQTQGRSMHPHREPDEAELGERSQWHPRPVGGSPRTHA